MSADHNEGTSHHEGTSHPSRLRADEGHATPLKIAIFHGTLPEPGRKLGGVEVSVHRLANALVEMGMAVTVISSSPKPQDALYDYRLFAGGRYRRLLLRLSLGPLALNFLDLRGFDLIHLHGDDWFYLRRPLPSVRTMHGSALQEARSAGNWKRKALQYAIYPLEQIAARLSTLTMAVGLETQKIYRAPLLADNGVDLRSFFPVEKSATPLLFYIGTWEGRKRGKLAYETFLQHVLPRFPDAHLYMACDGVPAHPAVTAVHAPETSELATWMRRSWVFLYPSVYEGFGIPYVEAMASGTAIVTTPNSGAEYVLENGRYGVLASDDQLGAAVNALLEDSQAREQYERAGLERARHFAWDQVAQRHIEAYRRAIETHAAK